MRATGPWVAGALFSVVPAAALTAIVEDPDSEQRWYAITKGKYVGITTNSILSTGAISGVSGAQHVSYSTQAEALGTFNFALSNHLVNVRH
jgi:hypothetical protein